MNTDEETIRIRDYVLEKATPEERAQILGTPKDEPDLSALNALIEKYASDGTFTLVIPDKITVPISSLSKQSVKAVNGVDDGLICINEKKSVTVQVESYLTNPSITLDRGYTKFMDSVQMVIGSLYDNGADNGVLEISAEEVYRAMNGLDSKDTVNPQAIGAVTKAIETLQNMKVRIDYRSDPTWTPPEDSKDYRKGADLVPIVPLLPEYAIYYNKAGRARLKYKVYRTPPFFEDSKRRMHIRTLPLKLLKIEGLHTSQQNTAIKFYLLQQIESMRPAKKGGKHRPTTIYYQTIFNDLKRDISFSAQNVRADYAKYREQITRMLDYWVKVGYIKSFKENKKGRSFESVTIFLD